MAGLLVGYDIYALCIIVTLSFKHADSALKAALRGRLAHMLCIQYELEQNFSTAAPPHKKPLYRSEDAPCRNIHWQDCSTGSESCEKFLSVLHQPCQEESRILDGELSYKFFEGDIVNRPNWTRAGNTYSDWRWARKNLSSKPDVQAPIIYYRLHEDAAPESKYSLKKAIEHIEACSCIRFEVRPNDAQKDYVLIVSDHEGCYSSDIGRAGGQQKVNLAENCGFGSTVHELLHVIGFFHEHSRPDRDEHVEIIEKNIRSGMEHNFNRISSEDWHSFGEDYDYSSIMHYYGNAFGDGKQTIRPLNKSVHIGQRTCLSPSDAIQLNKMYNCSTTTTVDPNKCRMYAQAKRL